jgi:hypothetical protein
MTRRSQPDPAPAARAPAPRRRRLLWAITLLAPLALVVRRLHHVTATERDDRVDGRALVERRDVAIARHREAHDALAAWLPADQMQGRRAVRVHGEAR